MQVERIDAYRWRVPRQGGMRTEGLIFADADLMRDLEGDDSIQQVANVAHLPGIVGPAIAMPDIHWGYGFPIGGVAAFDEHEGVVSPGGVGYDINCGVRLLTVPLTVSELRPRLRELLDALFATIPSGVGASRSDVRLQLRDLNRVLREGGRIYKTRFIMRYYDNVDFRRRINAGLNRMELFNALARHLFYARRGENWERDLEQQLQRASALLILGNACVLWNAVRLSEMAADFKRIGLQFTPEDFRHVSTYAFEHIVPYGQYFFNLRRKDHEDAFTRAKGL